MQNEGHRSYDFDFTGGFDNRYNFKTVNEISYSVRFKPAADYILPEEQWRDDFYELVIEVAFTPNPVHIPADHSIFPTIVAIISDFFAVHERVIYTSATTRIPASWLASENLILGLIG